jgi:hypothetical protein
MRLCYICKAEIELERIESMPETRLCTLHGQEIERFGGEFKLSATQERTSKAGSLKLNYGGITTKKVRNQEAIEKLKDEYDSREWET